MIDHDRFRESLVLHLAGELDPEEDAALRAHLEDCAACREEASSLAPLAPPAPERRDPGEAADYGRWRAGVLARTIAPVQRRTRARLGLAAAAVFVLGVTAGVLATRASVLPSPPPREVPGVERAATAVPFALPHPPPESRPSGFFSLAAAAPPRNDSR